MAGEGGVVRVEVASAGVASAGVARAEVARAEVARAEVASVGDWDGATRDGFAGMARSVNIIGT
jgi:hypothetical protein